MHFPYNCDSDSNYFALEKKYPTGLVPVVCKLNKKIYFLPARDRQEKLLSESQPYKTYRTNEIYMTYKSPPSHFPTFSKILNRCERNGVTSLALFLNQFEYRTRINDEREYGVTSLFDLRQSGYKLYV